MSKDKGTIIYASNVNRRTNMILRAFVAENDLTLGELMDILAHIVSGYSTMQLFREPIGGSYDPSFSKLDASLRDYMVQNYPDWYTSRPILRRLFGNLFKPISRKRLEEIDRILAELEEKAANGETLPEIDDEELEDESE